MRVAVTGGAGYIGSTLVKRLLDEGAAVTSIDNLTRGDYRYLRDLADRGSLELMVGDIRDGELLDRAFEGADKVVHLAALPGLT
ncbi:MAG: NAD-dependent epimerase/dehydratase family protein, partial [Candidatus Bathyarchaeia archaeon]